MSFFSVMYDYSATPEIYTDVHTRSPHAARPIFQPLGKAAVLLVLRHMDEQLDDVRFVVDLFGLEGVDLVIGAPPFGIAAKALHPFHQNPAVPAPVEEVDEIGRAHV